MAKSYVAQAGRTVPVLVAAGDIPPYYTFQPNGDPKVRVEQIPAVAVRRGTFTDAAQLAGRTTRSVIPANTPIATPYLAGEADGEGGSLAKSLRDAGRKAALSWSFAMTDAVAGRIAAGDRVDVLIVGRDKDNKPATQILSGVRVFDVVQPDPKAGAAQSGNITVVFEEGSPSVLEALIHAKAQGGQAYLRLLPAEGAPVDKQPLSGGGR